MSLTVLAFFLRLSPMKLEVTVLLRNSRAVELSDRKPLLHYRSLVYLIRPFRDNTCAITIRCDPSTRDNLQIFLQHFVLAFVCGFVYCTCVHTFRVMGSLTEKDYKTFST